MLKAKNSEKNRPIKKWKLGNLEICVWENKKEFNGGEVAYKTMTLTRSYKKKDEDIWRSEVINNIRRNDLTKFKLLLDKAEEYLYFEVNEKGGENE